MHLTAMVFAIFAALLHVFIFYMESISWTSEKTRSTFGMSEEAAENTKEMAFNQGFYNHALWRRLHVCRCLASFHHLAR